MTTRKIGPYIGGRSNDTQHYASVKSPYDGAVIAEIGIATPRDLERAIAGAAAAFKAWSRSATHERALVLERLALAIDREHDALARLIALESGKPIRYARAEVARAASTFRLGAAEARQL